VSRGIYLRTPSDSARVHNISVTVGVHFRDTADAAAQCAFERRLRVACDAEWVVAPAHVLLTAAGKTFEIRVDPTALEVCVCVRNDTTRDDVRLCSVVMCTSPS
jgi:hypothetical protein